MQYISIPDFSTANFNLDFLYSKDLFKLEPFGLKRSGGLKCLSNYFEHEHKMYEKMGVCVGPGGGLNGLVNGFEIKVMVKSNAIEIVFKSS